MLFGPIVLIVNLFVSEALAFRKSVVYQSGSFTHAIEQQIRSSSAILDSIPLARQFVHPESIGKTIEQSAQSISSFLASKALAIGSSSVSLLTNFFIFLFLVYFITPSLSKIRKYVENLSPLDNKIDKLYIDRTISMTSTVIKGTFIVALAQGMLGGLFVWLAGVDYVLTLTLAMIIASVIPVVGTGFITIPIAILLLLNGQTVPALIVFLGQIIVIANIDNIIRAELVSRETSLHPALMLISIFGGLQVFGLWGFIYGPVIMILFVTSLEIYQKHIKY
jgi:predicted PurR-regulated permease PerM